MCFHNHHSMMFSIVRLLYWSHTCFFRQGMQYMHNLLLSSIAFFTISSLWCLNFDSPVNKDRFFYILGKRIHFILLFIIILKHNVSNIIQTRALLMGACRAEMISKELMPIFFCLKFYFLKSEIKIKKEVVSSSPLHSFSNGRLFYPSKCVD